MDVVIPMASLLNWNITLPVQDEVTLNNSISIRCRGTSGAGQFELAGSNTTSGVSARSLIGSEIQFALINPIDPSHQIYIQERYPIRDIGNKCRISIQDNDTGIKRPNIGNLFAAVFLLPPVSGRGQSRQTDSDELSKATYWIDEIDCSAHQDSGRTWVLHPQQFILARNSEACIFDFKDRLLHIIALCNTCRKVPQTNGELSGLLDYFWQATMGYGILRATVAGQLRDTIMQCLAEYDKSYDGEKDPLPYLEELFHVHETSPKTIKQPLHEPLNLIYFGAPGTGKSHQLNKLAKNYFDKNHIRRVTFYPDYTYSQFVGSFRPYSENDKIGYGYTPGPFLQTYLDASLHPNENYLIIIEELNRANPAAVFGDVFQLLDRDSSGASEYSVAVPIEMSKCIKSALDNLDVDERNNIADYFDPDLDFTDFSDSFLRDLSLPPNMYIWATMNSADQGVFPMDTAFKRRWDFRYMGIDSGENDSMKDYDNKSINDFVVTVGRKSLRWNNLRKAINKLMREAGINEDKLLGPFFLSPSALSDEPLPDDGQQTVFSSAFKDKVLLYLYEDAGKMRRPKLFAKADASYSELCAIFDNSGVAVFSGDLDQSGLFFDASAGDPDSSDSE